KIRILINGNYQANTVHGFAPLLKKLKDAGLRQGEKVHFTPALAALGAEVESGYGSCHWSGSQPELMIALSDEVRRQGFDPGDVGSIGPCSFHYKNDFAIDPEGNIYKCPGFLGKTEWNIGHVATGLTTRYDGLVNINPQRLCGSCSHRPECAGGCVAAAWTASGRTEGVDCEIGFYERHGDAIVKRRYALAVSETPEAALTMFPPAVSLPERPLPRGRSSALRVIAV
ncbi:MAG TPA: SPASM domain-containing protein, partial [Casimicrobiaceae bacterium]|nr:SPASM domain-containing protein [Casimicrobiaceae bacterium]